MRLLRSHPNKCTIVYFLSVLLKINDIPSSAMFRQDQHMSGGYITVVTITKTTACPTTGGVPCPSAPSSHRTMECCFCSKFDFETALVLFTKLRLFLDGFYSAFFGLQPVAACIVAVVTLPVHASAVHVGLSVLRINLYRFRIIFKC